MTRHSQDISKKDRLINAARRSLSKRACNHLAIEKECLECKRYLDQKRAKGCFSDTKTHLVFHRKPAEYGFCYCGRQVSR